MIKVEVTKDFRLADFKKLKNVVRVTSKEEEGMLYVGDTFECDEEMAKYLTGENKLKRAFVKVIEVIPEVNIKNEINIDSKKIIEEIKEEKPKKKRTSKKKGE